MAIVLALDAGGDVFSAAVGCGDDDAGAVVMHSAPGASHASSALPLIQSLLDKRRLTLAKCAAFAFGAGPGKFSALRLVCSLARTFAYAHGKPLLAVPTFAALAAANYGAAPLTVKCALPAQRGHVYFGVCENSGGRWRVARTALRDVDGGVPAARVKHAAGAGYAQYPQLLGGAAYCDKAPHAGAAAVWTLAVQMLADNDTSDPLTCEPFYLRRKIAKTIHERQCGQTSSKN